MGSGGLWERALEKNKKKCDNGRNRSTGRIGDE